MIRRISKGVDVLSPKERCDIHITPLMDTAITTTSYSSQTFPIA